MADTDHSSDTPSENRDARILTVLAGLASFSALWAVFLWRELLAARAGETPFCGFGNSTDCGDLWSAAFASTFHRLTGVPVAGWGLVWALVAAMLPLAALAYPGGTRRRDSLGTAIEVTAAAGVGGVIVLLGASASEGLFCTSCALTYVLTLAYAAVTFLALRRPKPRSTQGMALAAGATIATYLLVLYPGLNTPKSTTEEGLRVLDQASQLSHIGAVGDGTTPATSPASETPSRPPRLIGGVDVDRMLEEFVSTLRPQVLQRLSDSLYVYRQGHHTPPETARVLAHGQPDARVRITEFTDILCGHCASLHQVMTQLVNILPPGSFNLDARHFPLDGRCNSHLSPREGDQVRCLAAMAQICVEESGQGFKFAGALFERQRGLTSEQVYELATPFIDRDQLDACMGSEGTRSKLADDVDFAWRYKPHGTPLVLVDGREGNPFPPFLYAIILAGGDAGHPAFASLPTPKPPPPHDHEH